MLINLTEEALKLHKNESKDNQKEKEYYYHLSNRCMFLFYNLLNFFNVLFAAISSSKGTWKNSLYNWNKRNV